MDPHRSWTETLRIGDIVLFNFPFKKAGGKIRTCAVVSIDSTAGDAVLAFGTGSLRPPANANAAVILDRRLDWQAAGLRKATLFQADRRIRVSLADPRFQLHQKCKTPILGRLPLPAAQRLMDAYLALPEIPAEEERRGIHPKPKDFTPARRPVTFLRRRRRVLTSRETDHRSQLHSREGRDKGQRA